MVVRIVNMRFSKHPTFKCDRTSPVGNPFKMRDNSEEERNRVCDEYYKYFNENLNPDVAPVGFLEYLDKILKAAADGIQNRIDVSLGCWCAPKRCHCETIKEYVDSEVLNYAEQKNR